MARRTRKKIDPNRIAARREADAVLAYRLAGPLV